MNEQVKLACVKEKTMWFRPSFIYSATYYDQTLSLRIQVTNETMDIPERERERQVVVGQSETNPDHKVMDEYCQPQNIYKKQKNLFAFAAAVNRTTLHPQNSKSLIKVLNPA